MHSHMRSKLLCILNSLQRNLRFHTTDRSLCSVMIYIRMDDLGLMIFLLRSI